MNIFISWSGTRSRKVAVFLSEWLQSVIQAVKPWISTHDIDNGVVWFNAINEQLANTTIGIICLTKENKDKPWILYETGALAKGLTTSRVCTFLIDLVPSDLYSPLAQFNHADITEAGMKKLISTINNRLGENKLTELVLDKSFDAFWPQFNEKIEQILKEDLEDVPHEEERTQESILQELLETVRSLKRNNSAPLEAAIVEKEKIVANGITKIIRENGKRYLMTSSGRKIPMRDPNTSKYEELKDDPGEQ